MKVVINGRDQCGIIYDFATELKKRGHEVVTISDVSRFVHHEYDYPQGGFFGAYYYSSNPLGQRILSKLQRWIRAISDRAADAIDFGIRKKVLKGTDLYIQVWADVVHQEEVLKFVKQQGAKIAAVFLGSDVRDYRWFCQQYTLTDMEIPEYYLRVPRSAKLRFLRLQERHADAIFSVPDQMGLALRPYHHCQVPLHADEYEYDVPGREEPLVVHAPSAPAIKGSHLVEACLDRLREEGVKFEFRSVRDMPNSELRKLLTQADVLIDQLFLHGPGWLSFEAMLSGCAVATRYLTDSPECFRPPVVPVDPRNYYEPIKRLLTDKAWRLELAEKGRAYALKNNLVEKVVDNLLLKTTQGSNCEHDYHPSYLRDEWVPADDAQAAEINGFNDIVREERWYQETVAGRTRGALKF